MDLFLTLALFVFVPMLIFVWLRSWLHPKARKQPIFVGPSRPPRPCARDIASGVKPTRVRT